MEKSMAKNEGERLATIEANQKNMEENFNNLYRNFESSIREVKTLIREESLIIKNELSQDRKNVIERLEKQDQRIAVMDSFRQKLLAQVGVIVAVGAIFVTFIYEFIKQWIHTMFK